MTIEKDILLELVLTYSGCNHATGQAANCLICRPWLRAIKAGRREGLRIAYKMFKLADPDIKIFRDTMERLIEGMDNAQIQEEKDPGERPVLVASDSRGQNQEGPEPGGAKALPDDPQSPQA